MDGAPVRRWGMPPRKNKKKQRRQHLLTAIKNNNVKDVVRLLRAGGSLSKKLDCYGSRYPLDLAIEQQNVEIIYILLQHGASVNTRNRSSGWTPLHCAVVLKNIAIVKIILQCDVDWNAKSRNGETVLHLVFRENYFTKYNVFNKEERIIAILKIFLDLGMDVNLRTNAGQTPLYLSVKNKMKKVAELLIERGADLNVCDYKGDTLAHLFVKNQYRMIRDVFEEQDSVEFLDYLLSKGLNVDRKNQSGEVPLLIALKRNLMMIFQVLLKYANNVDFIDRRNKTILHIFMEMIDLNNYQGISKNSIERIIKILLDKSASLDTRDNNDNTPLHVAASKKMIKSMLAMLDRVTEVNACNNNSDTVLHILSNVHADYEDDTMTDIIDVVEVLVFQGINVNAINKDRMTALQLAALRKNAQMLWLLKKYGADFRVRTACGESLLHLAIKTTDDQTLESKQEDRIVSILEILLDAGLDANGRMNNGETPFYLAVKNKMSKVIELLMSRGADMNVCNRDGYSVAHYLVNKEYKFMCSIYDDGIPSDEKICAKVRENLDFMDWLLSKGLNVDLQNDYGERPLQLAVKFNLLRVIPILLKYAQEVNFINERKLTILHMILQLTSENSDESALEPYTTTFDVKNVVETLLDKGVSVDIKDTLKNTALHIAAQQSRPELVSAILKYTKNVNERNDLGWTPLHFACEKGCVEIVKMLIDHGADVNATEDITGITPLFVAVYNDHADLLQILVEAGVDSNARDAHGQTPLHTVDSFKCSMSALLRLGADVDAKDDWGHVPIYYAMTRRDAAAIGQLLDFGANVSEMSLSKFVLRELLASDSVMGHHAKLMAAQLSIPKIYTSIEFRRYANHYKACLKEVERMRTCEIADDDRTTLYDFLHMSPRRRQAYEGKQRFRDVVESSLRKRFPLYCDVISAKRREARDKRSIVDSAKRAWWRITGIGLPDVCLENIFEYVDTWTLKAMSEGSKAMKRSAGGESLNVEPAKRQRRL